MASVWLPGRRLQNRRMEEIMERRAFLLGLAGAIAAAVAAPGAAEAASVGVPPAPQPVPPDVAAALDKADKAESQYYVVRRRYRPRRVVYYRPFRRRVVYYRPVRYRPVYVRRAYRPVRRYRPIVVF
jgi:hypothetical protein